VPFWSALGWVLAILFAVGTWIFVPHKLARWAMRRVRSPEIPTWKWLASVLTLFGYLGTTRRSLTAWLRKNRDVLYEQNFSGRIPVKEREKYCNLIHETDIAAFESDFSAGKVARAWITGVGGSGKSALAYRMLRVATEHKKAAPLPILVDEDWDGKLLDYVVKLLKIDERIPTPKMVEILGANGHLCVLVDSLSERGTADPVRRVADAIDDGVFKSLIVTSRQPRATGQSWEGFKKNRSAPDHERSSARLHRNLRPGASPRMGTGPNRPTDHRQAIGEPAVLAICHRAGSGRQGHVDQHSRSSPAICRSAQGGKTRSQRPRHAKGCLGRGH
jgi:hypothetical protein